MSGADEAEVNRLSVLLLVAEHQPGRTYARHIPGCDCRPADYAHLVRDLLAALGPPPERAALERVPDAEVLDRARAVLRRHGHGIGATCSRACDYGGRIPDEVLDAEARAAGWADENERLAAVVAQFDAEDEQS